MSLLSREKVAISLTSAILFWTWLQAIFIVTSSFSRYSLLTFPPLHLLTTVPPFSTPLLVFLFNYNCSETVPFNLFSMFENEREKREKKRDFLPNNISRFKNSCTRICKATKREKNKINENKRQRSGNFFTYPCVPRKLSSKHSTNQVVYRDLHLGNRKN